MKPLLPLLAAAAGMLFADAPRLVYTKEFPGSKPAYISIAIERDGSTVYKEAVNDEYPIKFRIDSNEADELFSLADKLDHFKRKLESGLNVAKMGVKTFRYEDGAAKHEVKFNYSQDEDARVLYDWFEKISETEQRFIQLERAVKYDKLGVHQELLYMQSAQERKRIVAPEQFLPLLDRVIKNDSYLHMARERAAQLADAIRARKTPKAE